MASIVAPELDSSDLSFLVKVHSLNAVHAGFDVFLSVQHLVCGYVAHLDVVRQQPTEHISGQTKEVIHLYCTSGYQNN